jgi:hypothetical protein
LTLHCQQEKSQFQIKTGTHQAPEMLRFHCIFRKNNLIFWLFLVKLFSAAKRVILVKQRSEKGYFG